MSSCRFTTQSLDEKTSYYYVVTAVSLHGVESQASAEISASTGNRQAVGWNIPFFIRPNAKVSEPMIDDAGKYHDRRPGILPKSGFGRNTTLWTRDGIHRYL